MMGGGKIICPRYRKEKNSIDAAQLRKINVSGGCRYYMLWAMCCGYTARSYYTHFAANLYEKRRATKSAVQHHLTVCFGAAFAYGSITLAL